MGREADHPHDHTSQAERFPDALAPGHVAIDERRPQDLLAFAAAYAHLLTYYDRRNIPAGDWAAFFDGDVSFLLAQIATTNTLKDHFAALRLERTQDLGWEAIDHIVLEEIYLVTARIDAWYRQARALARGREQGVERQLATSLGEVIKRELSKYITVLRKKEGWLAVEEARGRFDDIWENQDADTVIEDPIDVFEAFNRAGQRLGELAGVYLDESLQKKSDHAPHVALYLAFVHLFEHAQSHLNTLTERHLDYYYKRVLQLAPRAEVPDAASVYFRLAAHVTDYRLEAGTRLAAGRDAAGLERHYETQQAVTLHHATVDALNTLYFHKERALQGHPVTQICAFSTASAEGAPLEHPGEGWATFGHHVHDAGTVPHPPEHAAPDEVALGLVVASPVLLLREGERHIALTFFCNQTHPLEAYRRGLQDAYETDLSEGEIGRLLSRAFDLSLSVADGWFRVPSYALYVPPEGAGAAHAFVLSFRLHATDPAVETNEAFQEDFGTPWPLFKLLLNADARLYPYSYLNHLVIQKIRIQVEVEGLTTLSLFNDNGPLDPAQPFQPFGPVPVQGSYLVFGNQELSQKNLDRLELGVHWHSLPGVLAHEQALAANGDASPAVLLQDFETYYRAYGLHTRNDTFRGALSLRSEGAWIPLTRRQPVLYRAARTGTVPPAREEDPTVPLYLEDAGGRLDPESRWRFVPPSVPVRLSPFAAEAPVSGTKPPAGYFRLALEAPSYAFGHEVYPRLFAAVVTDNAIHANLNQANAKQIAKGKTEAVPLAPVPNPPFVPVVRSLSVSYAATRDVDLEAGAPGDDPAQAGDRCFHIYPFGRLIHTGAGFAFLPPYEAEGHLHLGLSNLKPPQTLSLLFHLQDRIVGRYCVAEAHEPPAAEGPIRWYYLSQNRWKALETRSIIADTTEDFTTTGIVTLDLPADMTKGNTILPPGLHWIKAIVAAGADTYGNTLGIYAQAAHAVRVLNGAAAPPDGVLPVGTMVDLVDKVAAIQQVVQPLASEGARPAEDDRAYRTRVSERLRHKHRVIQAWDYEHLVLEAFPAIGQTKCVTVDQLAPHHAGLVAPGEVLLVVIPALRGQHGVGLEPRAPEHLLREIALYLQQRASSRLRKICVCNPVYEYVEITACVRFVAGKDAGDYAGRLLADPDPTGHGRDAGQQGGYYLDGLHKDLDRFIAPWRHDDAEEVALGRGLLHEHEVLSYIEERPYIDYVTQFSMLHIVEARGRHALTDTVRLEGGRQGATIRASTPWSILVPVPRHPITVLDRQEDRAPLQAGVGNLEIGRDFIITTEEDARPTPEKPTRLAYTPGEAKTKRYVLVFKRKDLPPKT